MLLVPPAFQRKGVELYLVVAVEDLAAKLGVEAVYASTSTESPLLIRRNWKVVEEPGESGTDLFIFKRAL
jgi:N-acetylglutamate synthase-like GNAT family acetyltransferase